MSDTFTIPLGIKQGGISSPKFFSVYVDDLIILLRKSGFGCYLIRMFVGCILFADDMALIAPSRTALQKMVDICVAFCKTHCLRFNSKKSKIMTFGRSHLLPAVPIVIDNEPLDYVSEWKYLGTTIRAGKLFSFVARQDLTSFFRASNSILRTLVDAHEMIQLTLLYTNCVPIITYACGVKQLSSNDMSDCNVALNNALRKIFGFNRWESVRSLRENSGFPSLYELFEKARRRFLATCRGHYNPVIRFLVAFTHDTQM